MNTELNEIYSQSELKIVEKILIEHFCGEAWVDVLAGQAEQIHELQLYFLQHAVGKLKQNIPLEYVTGYAEFCDLKLWVNDSVLIPRPETEELVEYIRNHFKGKPSPHHIIDFGTGSGCIAIALKKSFHESTVYATDISKPALHTARYNANLHNLEVKFIQHDLLNEETLPFEHDVDVIVSNPPYVLASEFDEMHDRVRKHEPPIALFAAGDDTLAYYRCLKDFVLRYLKHGGCFMFELNSKNAEMVFNIYRDQDKQIAFLKLIHDSFCQLRFLFGIKVSN